MAIEKVDAIIIGAGQSGGPLSGALGEAGWRTVIVEREHVGGTCVNFGCTPTKTMVASARIAYLAQRSNDYGVRLDYQAVDLSVVRERKRRIVEMFRSGSRGAIEAATNVELIDGQATFTGPTTVDVALNDGGSRSLEAPVIVINAGARPRTLDIPGENEVEPLDSTSIMELDDVPPRLMIVGGGPIGLEFAQMFRRFGSDVTIVERGERLLPQDDRDISDALAGILDDDGIRILYRSTVQQFTKLNGLSRARLNVAGSTQEIDFDRVLIAAGRTPNTDLLDLEAAGVETDERGYIIVDDELRTNVDGIYALGDINGGPAFTHVSYDDFRIIRDNLIHSAGRSRAGRALPFTIYTDPQLGRIGINESGARRSGIDVLVFKMPMSSVARALEVDETRGLMKIMVERATGRIVGASVLGIEGGEIAGAIQIAMMGGLHYTELRDAVLAHPTLMESLNNVFSSPVES